MAFFVTMAARLAFSPVVPAITDSFDVSHTAIGAALTGMWLTYSLSQFPSGVLGDRFGEKVVILVAIGGTVMGSFFLMISPTFPIFAIGVMLLGAVAGLHYTPGTSLISRNYVDIGSPIGIHNAGGPLAGLLTPLAVAGIASVYGWRMAIGFAALGGIPIFVLFAWRIRPLEATNPERSLYDQFQFERIYTLLTRPEIAYTLGMAIIVTFVWQGTASFLPAFLISYRGHSPTFAGIIFSIYFVIQGISQVGVGIISDRYSRDFAIGCCLIAGITGFVFLIIGTKLASILLGVLFAGVGMSYGPALLPRFIDNLSTEESGAGFGLVRTVYGVLGASGSLGVGVFADIFNWGISFIILSALLVLALIYLVLNQIAGARY